MRHIINGENGKNLTLKEMLATSKFASYKTENVEEYMQKIKAMNLSDLHVHAIDLGIRPHSDRRRMERLLIQEFNKAKSNFLAACNQYKQPESEESKSKKQKLLDILKYTK